MKKNITVNLFGTLYNIDEDAYQLLESYLASMKRYFEQKDGNEEIANDIEHRVAELLWEKKEQGMDAVNIDIIKEIIGTIGNAEEIAGVDGEEKTDANAPGNDAQRTEEEEGWDAERATLWEKTRHHFRNRRLYRDPDDMLLGGVCSGLANYFGFGDPVLWRIIILLLFLLQGVGLISYLILWLIVPLARTPEDKLRMKGIRPNPDTINRQILQDHKDLDERMRNGGGSKSNNSGCLKALLAVILLPPIFVFIFLLGMALVAMVGVLGITTSLMDVTTGGSPGIGILDQMLNTTGMMAASGVVCLLIVLVIGIVLLVRWLFGSGKPMHKWTKVSLLVAVVLCLLWFVFAISQSAGTAYSIMNEPRFNINISGNTVRSINAKPQPQLDIPHMNEVGFHVVTNNTVRCTWAGDYPTGDAERRYMDASNYDGTLIFTTERTDTVKPGTYDLYALVRAEDRGGAIYAKTSTMNVRYDITPYSNKQGDLWKWACGNATIRGIERAYPHFCTDSIRTLIVEAHGGQGFGWSVLCAPEIIVGDDGIISYGHTTDPALDPAINSRRRKAPKCDWVSATDFVLLPSKTQATPKAKSTPKTQATAKAKTDSTAKP